MTAPASQMHADLLGRRRHTGVLGMLLGSVFERAIGAADCPVFVAVAPARGAGAELDPPPGDLCPRRLLCTICRAATAAVYPLTLEKRIHE